MELVSNETVVLRQCVCVCVCVCVLCRGEGGGGGEHKYLVH